MSYIVKDTSGGVETAPIPAGMHHAICYALIDIGTQPKFGNFPSRRKTVFIWELPDQRIEIDRDGKKLNLPRAISEKFTTSLASKSNMRPMLESWRGKQFTQQELDGFDMSKVVGANCFLNIIHEHGKGDKANRVYANVASVNPLPANMPRKKLENAPIVFHMDAFNGPVQIPETIPEWIRALIIQSDEYQAKVRPSNAPIQSNGNSDGQDVPEDDVPF